MVHIPRLSSDADRLSHGRRVALRIVGVRNRAGAVVGHPDHDLVLVRATGGGGGEDVVGDVDDGVGGEVGEGPGPGGLRRDCRSVSTSQRLPETTYGHRGDGANLASEALVKLKVGVGLDTAVRRPLPLEGRRPL